MYIEFNALEQNIQILLANSHATVAICNACILQQLHVSYIEKLMSTVLRTEIFYLLI